MPLPDPELPEGYQQHPSGLLVPTSAMPRAALIQRTPMYDDDGTGEVGTIINDAWKQELYNQIDAALATLQQQINPTTAWVRVPYNAANFFAQAGTFTTSPASLEYSYYAVGKTLIVTLDLSGASLSNATTFVGSYLPPPYVVAQTTVGHALFNNTDVGCVETWVDDNRLYYFLPAWAPIAAVVGTFRVTATIVVAVK